MNIDIDNDSRIIRVLKSMPVTQFHELEDYMAIYPTYQVIYVDEI